MRIALDTNILVYAEGVNDALKRDTVHALLRHLPQASVLIPVQVLGELFNVLVRKGGRSKLQAREVLLGWSDSFQTIPTSPDIMVTAADLAADHGFGIWDAVILVAASQGGCRLLLSEDLQNGFTWGGVTVVNPLMGPQHPLLVALLQQ
ncbi:PIN domain-containing protein [Niveispirillum sp. BGYR6]|uniref:PIN domain-containing protein n=1 Tax=Niveispirillum sp. BGYR6 TaxID=2971249 RepID=UPI0022B97B17|nr:PIN domain-containing protein [Niveispirillum sp. BGYR6]